ncbi:MAG: hypothetical protein NC122_06785 [Faecalibacterium sp.]|nr:hypothetical protein [Ruminococcus sp.]MCM1485895.1 hypothetical protein [Faecalibacterium sp.]
MSFFKNFLTFVTPTEFNSDALKHPNVSADSTESNVSVLSKDEQQTILMPVSDTHEQEENISDAVAADDITKNEIDSEETAQAETTVYDKAVQSEESENEPAYSSFKEFIAFQLAKHESAEYELSDKDEAKDAESEPTENEEEFAVECEPAENLAEQTEQNETEPADVKNETPKPCETSNAGNVSIESYFAAKGFRIEFDDKQEAIAPVESLAYNIAINYPHTKNFIRFIRENITRKTFDFVYSLNSLAVADRLAIISLAEQLSEYGIIANYYHNKLSQTIKGTVSSAPRWINFINGNFLEMYAKCVTIGVIKKSAEIYGCDYEFCHNAFILRDDEKHELDMVFRLGDQVFWSEIKSGKFNPDVYRKLGITMGLVPDKMILLAADKSFEAATMIAYFNECYCGNIVTFKSALIEMINKAFKKEVE